MFLRTLVSSVLMTVSCTACFSSHKISQHQQKEDTPFNDEELCQYFTQKVSSKLSDLTKTAIERCDSNQKPNHYAAAYATETPMIDGKIDAIWSQAPWSAMNIFWLGAQKPYPTTDDYNGRYKALWNEDYLFLLVDIRDDVIFDKTRDPFEWLWIDDTVEIFLDEDRSGGKHGDPENYANAWAYHISTYGENVDWIEGKPTLLDDHLDVVINSQGAQHLWEIRIRVYDDTFNPKENDKNRPQKLFAGKEMGFSIAYIDNDNSIPESSYERESMMGSVDTQGHKDNEGSRNADVLGSMVLIGPK